MEGVDRARRKPSIPGTPGGTGTETMTDPEQLQKDTEVYLARIRKTIADSERLVEAARLRMAETDRMLEKQGLTREQVMGFRFSPEQREAVNRELARQGLEPLDEESVWAAGDGAGAGAPPPAPAPAGSAGDELEERRKKFGMMMKPFQL